MREFLDKRVHLLHVSLHVADHAETTWVMDASDRRLYVSPAFIHMAHYAFRTTQVTDVNITQVTDMNITQVMHVSDVYMFLLHPSTWLIMLSEQHR